MCLILYRKNEEKHCNQNWQIDNGYNQKNKRETQLATRFIVMSFLTGHLPV